MIYLIDDTPVEMIQKYLNLVDYKDEITRIENLDVSMLDELKGADCILIHSSYHDAQMKKKTIAIADYGDEIPLVIFSDGDLPAAEWDGDNFITAFKKSLMYSYLPVFLATYRSTGKVNLKVLSDGEHYIRTEVANLATAIQGPLMFFGENAAVILNEVQMGALGRLVNLSQPEIGVSLETITEELPAMKVGELRSKINGIVEDFNRYGKNIHSWK